MNRKLTQSKIIFFFVILTLVISIFAAHFLPHDPNLTDINQRLQKPSLDHWFGTDAFGRDVFSRTLLGSKTSILSAMVIVFFSGAFGTFIGMLSGYYGGKIDQILMGICDIFLSFPQMIIAIGIAGVAGGGLGNAIIALAICNWMQYARLARSATLKEKNELYVEAIKFSGLKNYKILFGHIFVNIKELIIVTMAVNFATMLIGLAGLSFLGIGVQPPTPEWGSMINEGRLYLNSAPWICFFPSLGIVLVVSLFNLFGYSLQNYWEK